MVTQHYLKRAKERGGTAERRAMRMEDLAYHRGLVSSQMPRREREYMERKETAEYLPRYYNGLIYIYNVEGLCITCYLPPEWFGKKQYFSDKKPVRNPHKIYSYSMKGEL